MVEKIYNFEIFDRTRQYIYPEQGNKNGYFCNRLISDTIKDDETKARAILHGFSCMSNLRTISRRNVVCVPKLLIDYNTNF